MVVVDSSALIPLSKAGALFLLKGLFKEVIASREVFNECVVQGAGKPGTRELEEAFSDWVKVRETNPVEAKKLAKAEGLEAADASLVLLAKAEKQQLVSNDAYLIEVARAHGVECLWVTSLVLTAVKGKTLNKEKAKDVLLNIVKAGMNVKPVVFAALLKEIERL
ncbi:MAG TPA: hypothetical protein VJI67_03135 [archaeon]|nr:hypothetical protein [archaeon]HLD81503.1 hypothetical protein [archaeon]